MKKQLKNFWYTFREICQGSGRISILSILITTILLYCLFFFLSNSTLIPLLLGKINTIADYNTTKSYLENLRIDNELFILIPVLSSIITLITPSNQLKSNTLNRLLPIPAWTRIAALIFIIIISTVCSFLIVQILEYGTILYIRGQYMRKIITLLESNGDLYTYNLSTSSLFSSNYIHQLKSFHEWRSILILSMVFNITFLVINLYFNKYSIIKGVSLIFIILIIAFNIRTTLINNRLETLDIGSYGYESVYYFYFPILIICLVSSYYYLLKQKER